jgi:inosose dehydratase
MTVHVGTAPDSWGVWFPDNEQQPPWDRFLDEAVEAGYTAIELGPLGYLPTDLHILRNELEARHLSLAGAFLFGNLAAPNGWPALRGETAKLCDILVALDAHRLVLIPSLYTDLFTGQSVGPKTLDDSAWRNLADNCNEIGQYSRAHGILSVFHPHAESPVEHEDQIERFLDLTDPSLIGLCLDVGHHAYCGGDPVAFALKHGDRIKHLHLKSVDARLRARVRNEGLSFAEAVRLGTYTELDRGVVRFEALRDALVTIGYEGWGIVEQDMFPAPFDKPLPLAKRNREYLRSIGIG